VWQIGLRVTDSLNGRILLLDKKQIDNLASLVTQEVLSDLDELLTPYMANLATGQRAVLRVDLDFQLQPQPSSSSQEPPRSVPSRPATPTWSAPARSSGISSPKPGTATVPSEFPPPSKSTPPMDGGSSTSGTTPVTSNAAATPQPSEKSPKRSKT
jgi:hypothetical protein